MSLLGETFDNIIGIISSIAGGIVGFFGAIIGFIGKLLTILYYLFTGLEIIIAIVLNPYLLGLFILGTAFYYASFTAKTRKELMMQTGIYYKYVGEALLKIAYGVYTLVVRIVVGIIDMI